METQASLIETLFEKSDRYTRTSAELYKLKAIGKSAELISVMTARLAVIVFMILFFLILNIGIALWIGEGLGKTYFGFFAVAGFYALGGALLYFFSNRWITAPLRNSIILQALK